MTDKFSEKDRECFIGENIGKLDKSHIRSKVCQDLPAEFEHENNRYCLLHYPDLGKADDFEKEFEKRLTAKDYNFQGVYFPSSLSLYDRKFAEHVSFHSAIFVKEVHVSSSTFLKPVDFIGAVFKEYTYFYKNTFSQYVSFNAAIFEEDSDVSFSETIFQEVDLSYATFKGYVTFEGDKDNRLFTDENAFINLQNARLVKPDRISFHRVRLCPGWFVNTDPRKMVFTDVVWDNLEVKWNNSNIAAEVKHLKKREISEPNRLLGIACRQLAVNAEDNNRYEEASKFRYMAMETRRLEYFGRGIFWTINWWYRFSSGYGERWQRAALVLIGLILFFGILFALPVSVFDYGDKKEQPATEQVANDDKGISEKTENTEVFRGMKIPENFLYSLYVAALQRPEPKAANNLTKLLIILETIFAPLQTALLALAIKRKFMR